MGVTTVTTVTGLPIISFHARARVADYRDKPVTVVTVVTPPSAHCTPSRAAQRIESR